MEITYRPLNYSSAEDCELLARWNNDPSVKHLYNRFEDEESFAVAFTTAYFARLKDLPVPEHPHGGFMVLVDDEPVGQAVFEIDPPKLVGKVPNTAWIALLIGKSALRGCGLGKRIVEHLEWLAADAGAERIEIGVFEYNTRALGFFIGLGYEEFVRTPPRVWWAGRKWSDVRLSKIL